MTASWLRSTPVALALTLGLLFGGLVVDLNTNQALVIAIIYNIPIAISSVVLSRRLTAWTIALSMAANTAAGYVNAVSVGEVDAFTVLNRCFAALSFVLVGVMTLLFERSESDVAELEEIGLSGERERALRQAVVSLSGPLSPDELCRAAVVEIRDLLGADAVVMAGLEGDRFAAPRFTAPEFTAVAETGKLASWAIDALPVTKTPVITVRSDRGRTSVGRLRCSDRDDLVVVADRPALGQASALLAEVLASLVPLRERAVETERLRNRASSVAETAPEGDWTHHPQT